MRILFIHQNCPGQYKHLAAHLADQPGNEVVAVGEQSNLGRLKHPNITEVGYEAPPGAHKSTHPFVRHLENSVQRGQVAARTFETLRARGFVPDVVCCHPGWGDGLFVADVWPEARSLYFCEFFYGSDGRDVGFDPEFPSSPDDMLRSRIRTAAALISLEAMTWGISPTRWQRSTYPEVWRPRISTVFDGIDTDTVRPEPSATLKFSSGTVLTPESQVITFVSRNLEPYRGYHVFMRALPEIMARHPRAHVVIVGADGVSYGAKPAGQKTYKALFFEEVRDRLDLSRLHMVGKVPYSRFLDVLRVSSVHVYLTYPFVLSWSMLEAMSTGCVVAGSRTPPVTEFLVDGVNGLVFDFFDEAGVIAAVDTALDNPDDMEPIRRRARETAVQRCDLRTVCLPQQLQLIETLAGGGQPATQAD